MVYDFWPKNVDLGRRVSVLRRKASVGSADRRKVEEAKVYISTLELVRKAPTGTRDHDAPRACILMPETFARHLNSTCRRLDLEPKVGGVKAFLQNGAVAISIRMEGELMGSDNQANLAVLHGTELNRPKVGERGLPRGDPL